MNRTVLRVSILLWILSLYPISARAQKITVGARGGLSFFSYGNGSSAGIQIGPTFDYEFQHGMYFESDLNVNTQGGTPTEWANSVKYFLQVPEGATYQPYLDGGFGLWFLTGGPYFGIRAGGGVLFRIAPDLEVPADIQLGPVFTTGSTTFYLALTSGIRYTLP
ncbi:MAG TPA: hypothetical protein VI215_12610 [Bacteroidota bacterium]|jgi:hypothetical protein